MKAPRHILSDRSGSVVIIFAIVLVPILLMMGASLDLGATFSANSNYQKKLDSIALTAASAFLTNSGKSDEDISATIEQILDAHLKMMAEGGTNNETIKYTYEIDTKEKTVSLTANVVVKTNILQVVGHDQFKISLRSVAKAETESQPICILALGRRRSVGIQFVDDGKVKAKNCVIWSDAYGPQSITFDGRGKVESESLCAVGRVGSLGQFKVKPGPQSYCEFVPDPLSDWSGPVVGPCTHTDNGWIRRTTAVLEPGVYCGGLRVDAKNINLQSGLFIIKDGPLILRGSSKIKGKAASIYLTGPGSYLDIDGKSKVEIIALQDGPMAGIAIAADSTTVEDGKSLITGRSDLKIGGVVYLPNHKLVYRGESDTWAASPVTTIIADSIEIGGKAYLEVRNDKKKAKYAPVMETSKGKVFLINQR